MAPKVPQAFPIPEGVQRVPVIPFGGDNSFGAAFKSNFPTFKYDDPRFLNIFNNSGILGSQPSATNVAPGAAPTDYFSEVRRLRAAYKPQASLLDSSKLGDLGQVAVALNQFDPAKEELLSEIRRAEGLEAFDRQQAALKEQIKLKEEFDKKRDERNLLHQSILNLGNIPRRIVAKQGELMSETGRQLSALTAASLGGQQTSEKPIYQVKQYY
jgi:hypothetical protein